MNNGDALKALKEYYDIKNPTPDDEFSLSRNVSNKNGSFNLRHHILPFQLHSPILIHPESHNL